MRVYDLTHLPVFDPDETCLVMLVARASAVVFNAVALFFTWRSIQRAVRDIGAAHNMKGIGALRLSTANLSPIPLVVMKNCAFNSMLFIESPCCSPYLIFPSISHSSCSLLRVRFAQSFASLFQVNSLDQQGFVRHQYPRYCDWARSLQGRSYPPQSDARAPSRVG